MLHVFCEACPRGLTCRGIQEGHETIQSVQKGKNKCRFLGDFSLAKQHSNFKSLH